MTRVSNIKSHKQRRVSHYSFEWATTDRQTDRQTDREEVEIFLTANALVFHRLVPESEVNIPPKAVPAAAAASEKNAFAVLNIPDLTD